MTLLAIDIGNKLGWAVDKAGAITSNTKDFTPGTFENSGRRWLRLEWWLREINEITPLDEIYYEAQAGLQGNALNVYFGMKTIIEKFCEQIEAECGSAHVGTIKKHATGKGNANKEMMISAAIRRGHKPRDDNEADALALLYYIRSIK